MTSPYSVPASRILEQIRSCGFSHVVTVPDYVQMSVHRRLAEGALPNVRVVQCSTEDEVVTVAAGLHIGGCSPLAIMQNQGLYACCNALRAIGLDAGLPLLMLIGQFAREFSNLGKAPRLSERRLVRNTERLLDALDVPFLRMESPADIEVITAGYELSQERQWPVAVLVGAHTGWD